MSLVRGGSHATKSGINPAISQSLQQKAEASRNLVAHDQLQSPFFNKLPSEIRVQILTTFVFQESASQHIVHHHGKGGELDGFLRVPCQSKPDSSCRFLHISELRNLAKSPWRDGHWTCAFVLRRNVQRRRHRAAVKMADSVLAATVQSTSGLSTWSFSRLSTSSHPPQNEAAPSSGFTEDFSADTVGAQADDDEIYDAEGEEEEEESPSLFSPLPLLLSCRKLHDETAEILYDRMIFVGLKPLRLFLRQVTSVDYLDRIRHITVQWDAIVRTTPVLAHEFDDWERSCERIAQLRGLRSLDVKIFACLKTPGRTQKILFNPLSKMGASVQLSARLVRDCGDRHTGKEIEVVNIGENEIPIRVCRAGARYDHMHVSNQIALGM